MNGMHSELPVFRLRQGESPLLVSMPHVGTHLPAWLVPRLTPEARAMTDTDWHLDRLYNFLDALDATVLMATHSRYVIDLNRPPDNASLYPGKSTTALCPVETFAGQRVYLAGAEPEPQEIQQRLETYWQPYHATLADELSRLKLQHGTALLWDAHSIRSRVPRLFDGELPHFNIGTAEQQSCAPALGAYLGEVLRHYDNYSWVLDGRFKGGFITRRYGQPGHGVHAIQLELAMRAYMSETGVPDIDEPLANAVRPVLLEMMEAMLAWRRDAT